MSWTYEQYWNVVLGENRSATDVVWEFDLRPSNRRGLDEWLGHAEAEAWRVRGKGGEIPRVWAEHDELQGVEVE